MSDMQSFYKEIDKLTEAFVKEYYPDSKNHYWIGDDRLHVLHVYDTVYWGFEDICLIMQANPSPEDLDLYHDYLLRTDDIERQGDIQLKTFLKDPDKYRSLLHAEIKVEEFREEALAKVKATPTTFMPEF